jgi:hypothetical protein
MGGRSTRGAVQIHDQGTVWKEVARQNEHLKASSGTGTYLASVNSEDVKKDYAEYSRAIIPRLEERDTVGMIVAVNGRVHSIDIFGSPALFAKMKEKILKACVLDASGIGGGGNPPGKAEISAFYRDVMRENERELKAYDRNINQVRESRDAFETECLDMEKREIHRNLMRK